MKVLTIGSCAVDIITVLASNTAEQATRQDPAVLMLEQGAKITPRQITFHCGGGACNVAVSLRRLGFEVVILSKLGADMNGARVRQTLAREGIDDTLLVETDKAATGVAVILSPEHGNAVVFSDRGANAMLHPGDLRQEMCTGLDLLYVTGLTGTSAACYADIVEYGTAEGAMVAANPNIPQLTTWRHEFFASIGKLDLLCLNRTEADVLLPGLITGHADGEHLDLERFVLEAHRLGPRLIVVTDGVDGAYLSTDSKLYHCPAMPGTVVGTAGAGDAFNSTMAAYLTAGHAPEETLIAATLNAASVVEHADAQSGLLTRKMLADRVRRSGAGLQVRKL